MNVIEATCADEALVLGMSRIRSGDYCTRRDSRNGPVLEFDTPVVTVHKRPMNRVLFDPVRDANPYFHFMEALWMLAGRNDVEFPAHFAKNIANYSDDGVTLNGAYGHRWVNHFGINQLNAAIEELKDNPLSRRVVVSMWDPRSDLEAVTLDKPCNTQIFFKIVDGRLNMTVLNRSNDMIWGAYGANLVHFSFLQEYVAGMVGVKLGHYYQVSDSLHVYPEVPLVNRMLNHNWDYRHSSYYDIGSVSPVPLFFDDQEEFREDLFKMFHSPEGRGRGAATAHTWDTDWGSRFFRWMVLPMLSSHADYKSGKDGLVALDSMAYGSDWRAACEQWLDRRMKGRKE